MIRSFCSADQLRRRSTVEIISDDMCLTVLKHVNKDSMIHLIPPRSARRQCHSPERTLTLFWACAIRTLPSTRRLAEPVRVRATTRRPDVAPQVLGPDASAQGRVLEHRLDQISKGLLIFPSSVPHVRFRLMTLVHGLADVHTSARRGNGCRGACHPSALR